MLGVSLDSHHDAILSTLSIPVSKIDEAHDDLILAPKPDIMRHKVLWSEAGIASYQDQVSPLLSELRLRWLTPSSNTALSVLLTQTNNILSRTAISTNKSKNLKKLTSVKSRSKPKEIKASEKLLIKAKKKAELSRIHSNYLTLKETRNKHRSLIRRTKTSADKVNDEKLFSLLSAFFCFPVHKIY